MINTRTNWQVSLSKICHSWPNNAVTHECSRAVLYILGGVSNTRQIETSVMTVTV
jgi:hypothetical protein